VARAYIKMYKVLYMASKHERCIVHVDAVATIASLWQFFDNCSNGWQSQQSPLFRWCEQSCVLLQQLEQ